MYVIKNFVQRSYIYEHIMKFTANWAHSNAM